MHEAPFKQGDDSHSLTSVITSKMVQIEYHGTLSRKTRSLTCQKERRKERVTKEFNHFEMFQNQNQRVKEERENHDKRRIYMNRAR